MGGGGDGADDGKGDGSPLKTMGASCSTGGKHGRFAAFAAARRLRVRRLEGNLVRVIRRARPSPFLMPPSGCPLLRTATASAAAAAAATAIICSAASGAPTRRVCWRAAARAR